MSEIDEILEEEQARLTRELKALEKQLNKGVPLSSGAEKLVLRVVEHTLNARIKPFNTKRVREDLKVLKDLFTYRLEVYEERKHKRYEQARNMLIPQAQDYADTKVAERDEEWSRFFFERMNELASQKLDGKTHLWLKNSWE